MPTPIDVAFVEVLPDFKLFAVRTRAGITEGFAKAVPAAAVGGGKAGAAAATAASTHGKKGGEGWLKKFQTVFIGKSLIPAALVTGVGIAAVKMAGDFQSQMVRLVTAAGETKSNLAMISAGVLKTARETGVSTTELAGSIYYIESAGIHGSKALEVLKAAAQGAKVDMADAATVANALTTAMIDIGNATHMTAATMMSQLIATVAHGKMTMQDLAASLHSVLPNAAALGLSFAQTGGAIATMTAQGISAQQATQNLNHAILSLANPTAVQTKAMAAFGLSSSIVARDLGKVGLTGTLQELSKAITSHMGPAGLTITNSMNTSAIAAGKANEMFKHLSPQVQGYAKQLLNGTMTTAQFRSSINKLSDNQSNMARQWLVSEHRARGFSDLLKSASPSALTYVAALSKMTGGQVGLQVALHLTGQNMPTYLANVKAISAAHADAAGNVSHWEEKQKTFNQKMSELKQVIITSAIAVGLRLMPALTAVADWILTTGIPALEHFAHAIGDVVNGIKEMVQWIRANQGTFKIIASVITFLLLPALERLIVRQAIAFGSMIAGWVSTGVAAMSTGIILTRVWVSEQINAFKSIATHTAAFAVMIAGWIRAAAVAMAQAIRMAAAWLIAAGPLGWITLAIIALVALIIWKWDTIYKWTKKIFSAVWNFIRDHWRLIVIAITGPLGALVIFIIDHWNQILGATVRFWNAVSGFITHIVDEIVQWIAHHWGMALFFVMTAGLGLIARTIISHWLGIKNAAISIFNAVIGFFKTIWSGIKTGFANMVNAVWQSMLAMYRAVLVGGQAVLLWFARLPGRIIGYYISAGRWLIKAGRDIIAGLASGAQVVWNTTSAWFSRVVQAIKNFFATAPGWLLNAGKALINGFLLGARISWNATVQWFQGAYMWVVRFGSDAGKWLLAAGKDVVNGLGRGLKKAWDSVAGWFKSLPKKILGYLNIHSPPPWAISAGEFMMKGILKGIINKAGGAAKFLEHWAASVGGKVAGAVSIGGGIDMTKLLGSVGGGLGDWIMQAMKLAGVGMDWFTPILRRIMFESGGNPNAINLTDSNAAAGHPSMGLMQTIASTFAAYSLPGHTNVWNPVDNIIAGIRYIIARYGGYGSIDPPIQGYKTGAWNIPKNQLAMLHKNEMVVPGGPASMIRGALSLADRTRTVASAAKFANSQRAMQNRASQQQNLQFVTLTRIAKLEADLAARNDALRNRYGDTARERRLEQINNARNAATEAAMMRGIQRALEGIAIRFDGDGLARLVSKKQAVVALKGPRV